MNKMDNLIESLDSSTLVKDIKELNNKILKDKELSNLLKKYNEYPTKELKQQIIDNKLFQEYKVKETDLNILILEINKKLKEISKKGECLWK